MLTIPNRAQFQPESIPTRLIPIGPILCRINFHPNQFPPDQFSPLSIPTWSIPTRITFVHEKLVSVLSV